MEIRERDEWCMDDDVTGSAWRECPGLGEMGAWKVSYRGAVAYAGE